MIKNLHLYIFIIFFASSCTINKENSVNLCRCLNEPGDSDWMKNNKTECNKLISSEIGVSDWKKVNFSLDKKLSDNWDIMVNKCVNKIIDESSNNVTFKEAESFIINRCQNIGQKLIDSKIVNLNKKKSKLYYFLSQSIEHEGYYCLMSVSSNKLELLGNVKCGKSEILKNFNSK